MEKDLYTVLGLQRNADQNEIKKAYRELSLLHHPDKPTGNEEKFKEINNAYGILGDEEKRRMYDMTGQTQEGGGGGGMHHPFANAGPFGFGFGPGGFHMNVDMHDIFGAMFGSAGGQGAKGNRKQKRAKGPTKTHEVGLRLHDFYHGKTFRLELKERQAFCDVCQGEGCKNWKTCADCRGAGVKETMMQIGPGMMAVNRGPCMTCQGEGRQRGTPCDTCNSKGLVSAPKGLDVVIQPGACPGDVLTFEGMCSDHPDFEKAGDVQIRLAAVEEHLDVEREGHHLKSCVTVSLKDSLLGCKRIIQNHPGGEVEVDIPACVQNGEMIVVEQKGMPLKSGGYGNLLIVVTVTVSKEERETVENSKAILQSLFQSS